jgi:hypothetical protein
MFLVGAASNYPKISLPFDVKSIVISPFDATTFTLDVLLMVVGAFFMIIAGVFHRINPLGD